MTFRQRVKVVLYGYLALKVVGLTYFAWTRWL